MNPDSAVKPLDIIHRDEWLVAVSKPCGLLVHRTPASRDRTFLLQRLTSQVETYLSPVHRIDRAASGIVIFATSRDSARWLQQSLNADTARKEYLVLARGRVPHAFSYFRALSGGRAGHRAARTTFEPQTVYDRCTLLRVRLRTGRHHQIRRHLNHLGHHVIGDTTHGKGHVNREFRDQGLHRMFLHHTRVALYHEGRGRELVLEDPLPRELQWVLERLDDPNTVKPGV